MSNKILHCAGCHIKVAVIMPGSKIKKGMVVLCDKCETKRQAADLAMKTKGSNPFKNTFGDMFGGFR